MPFRLRKASSSMMAFRRGSCPEEASLPHRRRGLAGLSLLEDRSMLMRSRVCKGRYRFGGYYWGLGSVDALYRSTLCCSRLCLLMLFENGGACIRWLSMQMMHA